jgi:hypothetical protein
MLDALNEIVTEGHFVRNGLILLGIIFVIILTLKTATGKWRWKQNKELTKNYNRKRDIYNKQKYGIIIKDIPDKNAKSKAAYNRYQISKNEPIESPSKKTVSSGKQVGTDRQS